MHKKESPLFSVIIPIHNSGKQLRKCLQSIREQTFTDYEVLLINDGSQDNSLEICHDFYNKDSRFKLFNQKNQGVGVARNKGLTKSTGEYILFIDSDDWIDINYFESIQNNLKNSPDIIMWGFYCETDKGTKIKQLNNGINEDQNCISEIYNIKQKFIYGYVWACCFKNDIIKNNNIKFPEDIFLHEDTIFTNIYCKYVKKLNVISALGYHYQQIGDSLSRNRYISSDEAYTVATKLFSSTKHWHNISYAYKFELDIYIGYLIRSFIELYNKNNKTTFCNRIKRIKFILKEIKHLNYINNINPYSRRIIMKTSNPFLVDFVYSLYSHLK